MMERWSFLTRHGRALLLIAHDPDIRLRDLATGLNVAERRAHGIVDELTRAGYLLKERVGRRNRYQVQAHLPVSEAPARERAIGEVLDLLNRDPAPPEQAARPSGHAPSTSPTARTGSA